MMSCLSPTAIRLAVNLSLDFDNIAKNGLLLAQLFILTKWTICLELNEIRGVVQKSYVGGTRPSHSFPFPSFPSPSLPLSYPSFPSP